MNGNAGIASGGPPSAGQSAGLTAGRRSVAPTVAGPGGTPPAEPLQSVPQLESD